MNGKTVILAIAVLAVGMQAAGAQECRKIYVNKKPVTICPQKPGPMKLPNPTVPPKKPSSHRV
ncbi:hypothetical protein QA645_41035 [Bradyrhizobium sp. CIAT3101]|uniref:hypothetical protein n=1 Tax=Bradyrhizobium sp. CIAT3101 TaxID=439387 RepID=UPI0024B0672C|nr:hypothetical protein [Bradyrhizobium sp. CIAT3101]WFU80735.1 hypothetical protein QA645_41035 [Bradyrhizobium sp. CIAT3101]